MPDSALAVTAALLDDLLEVLAQEGVQVVELPRDHPAWPGVAEDGWLVFTTYPDGDWRAEHLSQVTTSAVTAIESFAELLDLVEPQRLLRHGGSIVVAAAEGVPRPRLVSALLTL